jgi:hypothetical protein
VTERNGPDDETRRIDPDDESEATRAFDPFADDETRAIPAAGDDATRRIEQQSAHEPTATQRIGVTPAAEGGPRTERIALAEQRSLAGWLIALVIVVSLGVGMAIGYAQSKGNDDGLQTSALVGPSGGVLDFADGKGRLEIPQGALPTGTAIRVRKVTNENRVRLGAEGDPRAALYEPGELDMFVFEPPDLTFQQPVKITLPLPASGSALLVDTPEGPRVVGAEKKGETVTFETTTFSFEDL